MKKRFALDIAYIAMFTAIICVCAWISIPSAVPFTLQTFGIFLTVGVLGGKRGTIAVACYLLLGILGAPVFAGFRGGAGVLFGVTGGYIAGFLFSALVMWAMEVIFGKRTATLAISMILGLFVCYAFGTAWFMAVYANGAGGIGLGAALMMCVVPYIVYDFLKIILAIILRNKLIKHVKTYEPGSKRLGGNKKTTH